MSNFKKKIFTPSWPFVYLITLSFFTWGLLAGHFEFFPWNHISKAYDEIYEYLTHKGGPEKSKKELITLDHQEYKSKFDFQGFKSRDPHFQDKGYLLIAGYSKEHGQTIAKLYSLSENRVLHEWIPPQPEIFEKSRNLKPKTRTKSTFRVQHPLLLDNGDLIFTTGEGPMVRIDACGNVKWVFSRHFHHSIELDHNGNLVTCIWVVDPGPKQIFPTVSPIRDDGFAIVSLDGTLLMEKSVTELLLENGYRELIYGIGPFEFDRIHLNDAQPILTESIDAQVGDIALSIRNLSTVVLISPKSGKIKWLKTGPWLNQHDVNQLENGLYSVFGNDTVRLQPVKEDHKFIEDNLSNIYIYDPTKNMVSKPYQKVMEDHKIGTLTVGRLDILPNGDAFIEETNSSRLLRISKDKVRWEYVNSLTDETNGALHWSRYIEKEDLDLKWLENKKCN